MGRETLIHSIAKTDRKSKEKHKEKRFRSAVVLPFCFGAGAEMAHAPEFEYVIINEDFDTALLQLEAIVTASRLTYGQQALRFRNQFANLGVPV